MTELRESHLGVFSKDPLPPLQHPEYYVNPAPPRGPHITGKPKLGFRGLGV